ncbi:carbohydrate sulfotransferase [Elysia marginata]|uniref:Carbohydrate sulfotransferase n=1 Tax=Elysia marginata TaxID=1093978 RepID=A0AAV4IVZ8_9GAST|nr:carbohydrate sulfotransferase [Elysia marginata]
MIVDYNFRKLRYSRHVRRCASAQEIAYRLWSNFRWRGYIDPNVDYVPPVPEELKLDAVKENLESQLVVARTSGLKDRTKLKAAKEKFYRKIYLTLSPDLFEKLLRKYSLDFKFYGYEKQRDELRSLFSRQ